MSRQQPSEAPTPPRTGFGLELERRRNLLNLSQREAAGRTTYSYTVWGQHERGRKSVQGVGTIPMERPTKKFVMAAAKALEWDLEDAFKSAGYEPDEYAGYLAKEDPDSAPADASGWDDWAGLIGALTPEQQKAHKAFLVALVGEQKVDTEMPTPRSGTKMPPASKKAPRTSKPASGNQRKSSR